MRRDHPQPLRHRRTTTLRRPIGVGLVEAAPIRIGTERVGNPDHGFGRPQHQHAVGLERFGDALEDRDLGILVEIDQDVAAEDHVELAEMGKVLQQIELALLHHAADIGTDLPEFADLGEVLDQQLNRQSALHLELAVDPRLGLFENFLRQVGGDDLDPPACQGLGPFLQAHRNRVRLLAARTRRGPDSQRAAVGARLQQRRQDRVAQMIERNLVAEEEGLVGGHCLHDLGRQRFRAAFHFLDEFGNARQAGPARQRDQPALDQILLVGGEIEARALFQEPAQEIIILYVHERSPENSRTSFWAIWLSGRTAAQIPAFAAAPGMPQTTLVASSWATMLPPAATISLPPRMPSEPMPVRITARIAPCQTSMADMNNGSTAGLQKLTAGPSSSAICTSLPCRATRMWQPPGAR